MNLEQAALEEFKKYGPTVEMSEDDKKNAAEAVEAGEVATEVMENKITQKVFNKAIEKLDDSVVMKPFRASWDAMPGWAQDVYINPVARAAMGVTLPGLGAMWFDKMVKCGLLKLKSTEGPSENISMEERQKGEEQMRNFAGEAGKIATAGEASGIIDMVIKVVGSQDRLMEGARNHLNEVHAEKERQAKTEALKKDEAAIAEENIAKLRKGIENSGDAKLEN